MLDAIEMYLIVFMVNKSFSESESNPNATNTNLYGAYNSSIIGSPVGGQSAVWTNDSVSSN